MTHQKLERELTTKPEQPEQEGQGATSTAPESDIEQVQRLASTQHQVQGIKTHLEQLLLSMNQSLSLLTRAAIYWNTVPLWKKIVAGLLVIVPLLVLGILTLLTALITLSVVIAIVYTLSSLLLDNHHHLTTEQTERLKVGVTSMANLLDSVISALEHLGSQLAAEVAQFKAENERLTLNVNQLSAQGQILKKEVSELTTTEQKLRAEHLQLEASIKTLKVSTETQTLALEKTQAQLNLVVQSHAEQLEQLGIKNKALEDINAQLGQEFERASSITRILRTSLASVSKLAISDEAQRTSFLGRLNEFLSDKEQSLYELLGHVDDASQRITELASQLEESNVRYSRMLDNKEQYINQLEQLVKALELQNKDNSNENIKPSQKGFFAAKIEPVVAFVPVQDVGASPVT